MQVRSGHKADGDGTVDQTPPTNRELSFSLAVRNLGLDLTEEQLARFDRVRQELLEWNSRMNLTAITNPLEVQTRHFLDSLTALAALTDVEGLLGRRRRIVDVGSGAGFPGIPLAIVLPDSRVTLVEATQKKCRFLDHVVGTLELENVEVVCGRSEDVGNRSDLRERFDAAVARALAPLPTLVELCLPFIRLGGRLIAMKKIGIDAEIRGAEVPLTILGGRLRTPIVVSVPTLDEQRQLVVVDKVSPTPRDYPRRAGIAGKSPLGSTPERPSRMQRSLRRWHAKNRVPGTGGMANS